MNDLADIYSKLERYGLKKPAVTIYIMLLKSSSLRVNELVKACDLPRSSVYEHLKILVSVGLVQIQIRESYKLYTALPFKRISDNIQEQLQLLQSLQTELDTVDTMLKKEITTSTNDIQINYFTGISGARQLLWNTLKSTDTVRVYSSWGRSRYVGRTFYERFVEESRIRKINEKVLINDRDGLVNTIKEELESSLSRTKLNAIRYLSEESMLIKGETFIYGNVYAQIYLKQQNIIGFEINGPDYSQMQRNIFDLLWENAKQIK